jgi:LuxR family maltose regulon positive regulatory protein
MMSGLLATKLRLPRIPAKRVDRPFLLQQLNEGLEAGRQLSLISAPAGFGKTTCAVQWVCSLDLPAAWLSLDPGDDDPGRFFTYLVAALQRVDEKLGHEIEGILRAGQLPPGEIISATLTNDILDVEHGFLLVLDDLQVIQDPFILQVLEQLIENQPQTLHLVLLTREDPPLPLARLRANNQLTEIRIGELRFTGGEAGQFVNGVMGLSLSEPDVTLLLDRTEGWIAGLQLAALAMKAPRPAGDQPTPAHFIAALSGSHRYILSYLTEEVLSRQPEDIQQFLLQTSILDRLCGDLCRAVTGRLDSQYLLERLSNANLFLIPLDDEGRWYRYHQLFADLLRGLQGDLQKEQIAELHRRAGRWYAQEGMADEAIRHAVASQDFALAVQMLEGYSLDMLMQWHIKTVEGWMQAIPPAWRANSPKANLAFAWMHLLRGTYPLALPYLERLQELFSGSEAETGASRAGPSLDGPALEGRSLLAEWLALQAALLSAEGKPGESLALCRRALELAPEEDGHARCLIYMELANAYQRLEDYEKAAGYFQLLIQSGRATGNNAAALLGESGLGLMSIERGQLQHAYEIASEAIERIERSGTLPPVSTALYGEIGAVYYHRHQLEQAHKAFQRAIQVGKLSGYSDAEIYYAVILSRLYGIEGNLEAAQGEIQKAVDLMRVEAPRVVREEAIAQQVRVALDQGRLSAAEEALHKYGFSFQDQFSYPELQPSQNLSRPTVLLYLSALRVLLYRAQAGAARRENRFREAASSGADLQVVLAQGIDLADQLLEGAIQRQYLPLALEILLLRAQMYAALGDRPASRSDILGAVELAKPEGFISLFLEAGPSAAALLGDLLKSDPSRTSEEPGLQNRLRGFIHKVLAAFPPGEAHPAGPGADSEPNVIAPESTAPVASPLDFQLVEPLSERELEVLQWIGEGCSNGEIAERLVITLHTVKKHTSNIYSKLGVASRTQALARARNLKLI